MMNVEPVVLEGTFVRLEPLSPAHHIHLCEVGLDPEIWRWTTTVVRTPEDMHDYIEAALRLQSTGSALPFTIIDRASGRAVGSTRYGSIDVPNRRVEIGWTWIGQAWQRTPLNTEAKYLLLRHAFEELDCIRVELKTDVLNERSRRAILRIGAREEGILRRHAITAAGRVRDTVYYGITDEDWTGVRAELERKLARPPTPFRRAPSSPPP